MLFFVNYFSCLKHQNLEYISVCLIRSGFITSKFNVINPHLPLIQINGKCEVPIQIISLR